ncbi:MAG: hypothetical protein ABI520_00160 [Caldimonas sp.]
MTLPLAVPAAWLGPWAELQRVQWQAIVLFHNSLLAYQKELWEQWACRYAGGAPLDS